MKKLIPLLLSFLIILSLIPLDVQASSNYSTIKVGLTRLPLSSQVTFTVNGTYSVSGDDSTVLANKKTYNVKVESGKLALYDGQTLIKRYSSPLKLVAGAYNTSNSLKISTNSYPYCGNMIFTISSGNIFLINEVGFEEYILGVLPGEMPKNWHKEALKAQAVAARSYTLANRNRHSGAGYEICDNEHCQMYIGYIGDNNLGNAGAAVAETRGQYLTYNGKPISACYCSSNGGITESANNAWGSADVPYLVVKEDPHDIAYRNQTVTIKKQGFDSTLANNIKNIILTKKLLNNKGYSLQPNDITVKSINNLKITEYNKTGGRAAKAVLDVTLEVKRTSDGKKEEITQSITLIRGEIRSVLGLRSLLIVKFEEDKDKDCYRLVTNGYGHGVGMGQYGAKARAEAGHGYKNILSFYYPGTTMATISYPDVTPPSVSSVSANPDCIVAGEANSTKINYTLSKASKVTVVINDASGKRVRDLMTNTDKAKGSHSITWDLKNNSGSKVGQGVYTFVVIAQDGEGNKASRSGTVEIVTKKSGTVTASSLNIRKGPGTSYAVLTTLPKGTKVDILSKANGWYKVRLSDGRIGYAVENYISEGGSSGGDSQPSGREGIVTASALNVRKSASTSSSVLGVLRKNDRVEILGKTGSWYKIKAGKLTGYVHGDYLKEVTPVSPPSSGGNDKKPPEDKAPPPDKKYGIVTASALNVRSGAGTKNSRIGVIQKNTKVEILGTSGEWYKIKAGSLTGYVHGDYIKITSGGGSTPSDPTPPAGKTYGTVTASALNVRKSASTSAAKVGLLPKGKQVEILGSSGKWYKIKSGSITGYVHSDYIKITSGGGSTPSDPTPPAGKTYGTVTASALNVRKSASTSAAKVGLLPKGKQVEILGSSGKWYKIKSGSITGYVHSDYIKITSGGGSTPSNPTPPAGKTYGTVTASALNVRKSASTSAAKVGLLPKGKQVEILGSSGKWYKIKSGSITGYVHGDYIKITGSSGSGGGGSSSSSTKTVTVTASSGLNVRSGPGTNYKRITVAKKGTKLQVLSQSGKWLKVKLPSGTTGYVISDYVK